MVSTFIYFYFIFNAIAFAGKQGQVLHNKKHLQGKLFTISIKFSLLYQECIILVKIYYFPCTLSLQAETVIFLLTGKTRHFSNVPFFTVYLLLKTSIQTIDIT